MSGSFQLDMGIDTLPQDKCDPPPPTSHQNTLIKVVWYSIVLQNSDIGKLRVMRLD